MTDVAIQTLQANLIMLSSSDQNFARSLIQQGQTRGLSSKQMYWVNTLNDRATAPKVTSTDAVDVGSFEGVIELFKKAQEHLKRPKIRLQLEDGSPICLSVAGPGSKAPGEINITDGRPFGDNIWYGRVAPDGAWKASMAALKVQSSLITLLQALATEPAKTAAHYGKLTGQCCFCNKNLSDERSTAVGYGKTCSEHYGLVWG